MNINCIPLPVVILLVTLTAAIVSAIADHQSKKETRRIIKNLLTQDREHWREEII